MSANLSEETIKFLMTQALEEANNACKIGEVPIGAVVSNGREVISRAHNLVEKNSSVTKHAELLAIEKAGIQQNDWRLNESILCVTIEPCSMCIGAIKLARINTLIIGASDPSMGACGSIYDLSQDKRFGAVPRVITGILETECSQLIKNFFLEKRK
jgi:tRNA(adenine34) deaminase